MRVVVKMFSFIFTAVLMFIFWFCLSGQTAPLFLILGAISSLLVAFWSHDLLLGRRGIDFKKFIRLLQYLPWLAWQIVLANLHLVYLFCIRRCLSIRQ
jgi:multicomponent Na+:H+ antiporter subunit E